MLTTVAVKSSLFMPLLGLQITIVSLIISLNGRIVMYYLGSIEEMILILRSQEAF